VAHDRHNGRANYLFVDGHVESLPVEATFVARSENLWNPSVAGLAGSTP
jgi:prepilin-type processing-associated H-X9-DG protein